MKLFYRSSILFLILILNFKVNAQSDYYIFGMGGLNYITMEKFTSFFKENIIRWHLPYKNDEIGFNGEFGIKYFASEHDVLSVSSGIESKNVSYYGGFGGDRWNFRVMPVSAGYQYFFLHRENSFRPYAGVNISYSFIEINCDYFTDTNPFEGEELTKKNLFGLEPNIGFTYKIVERFYLLSEFKYRYVSSFEFIPQDLNLSGLITNFGILINVL